MASPNGETDMNDIDIEEGRRLAEVATAGPWEHRIMPLGFISGPRANIAQTYDGGTLAGEQHANGELIVWLRNNAAAMFDAIERGRQWETIARRIVAEVDAHFAEETHYQFSPRRRLERIRDLADRTLTPTATEEAAE
jgi:hypothetical protein